MKCAVCMLFSTYGKWKTVTMFIANICRAFQLKALHQSQGFHATKDVKLDYVTPHHCMSGKL